jgi:single-strand DNA-binding protein
MWNRADGLFIGCTVNFRHDRRVQKAEVRLMNELACNEAELAGQVAETPAFSHENHGSRFYRFSLSVPRLSGQDDILPVLIPERLAGMAVRGKYLRVKGQFRSYNNKTGQGSRLILALFAQSAEECQEESENRIRLRGTLCKPPVLRRTPLGRSICDLMLAVPRKYGRADYLPVIAWGRVAADVSEKTVGDSLMLEGRMQSRTYTKPTESGNETRTAYEISVMCLLETSVKN